MDTGWVLILGLKINQIEKGPWSKQIKLRRDLYQTDVMMLMNRVSVFVLKSDIITERLCE